MKEIRHRILAAIITLCGAFVLTSCHCSEDKAALHPEEDCSQFVNITDVVPDVILEIRYYGTYNFVGTRIDGYEQPTALLTRQAAEALKAVSDEVKAQGYRLKIYDAYRPQKGVDHFVRWAADLQATEMKPYFYPDLDKEELFIQGYIAKESSHSRGSAVDLTLLDMSTGEEVDMGSPFDLFSEVSHPDYRGVTDEQHENRMLLRNGMIRNGFEPLDCEWWHFTLKKEPYPDTYFEFPVSSAYLRR
jgi:D-alanyl-D-alanine dipeptidase